VIEALCIHTIAASRWAEGHGRAEKQRELIEQVGAALLPEQKTDDTDSCRPGADRCRQICRQGSAFDRLYDWFFSGALDALSFQHLLGWLNVLAQKII
jgi:hypothetical protein